MCVVGCNGDAIGVFDLRFGARIADGLAVRFRMKKRRDYALDRPEFPA
jgi:hypothetical protein